jgi:hypothetical protein
MAGAFIVIVVILFLVHLAGAGHSHRRNRGRGANIGWSLKRGWWGSFHPFGGTYYHDL